MKRYVLVLLVVGVAIAVFLQTRGVEVAEARTVDAATASAAVQLGRSNARQDSIDASLPTIPYESVPLVLKTPPGKMVGETVGVAFDSQGHLYVSTRTGNVGPARGATAAALYEFNPDGSFIKEWGEGSYAWSFAHEVEIDDQDNVWVTDEGSGMVVKFNPDGQVEMVLGRKPEAIDYIERFVEEGRHTPEDAPPPVGRPNTFDRPTNVTWDNDGNIYVADGYGNSRVAKFTPDGDWVGAIGTRGDSIGQFSTPHDIARDNDGNIYVADRGNNRIQVLDNDLNVIRVIDGIRSPWAICITPGPTQYIYSADVSGVIYKVTLDGTPVGIFGKMGKSLGEFYWIHALACPSENEIYTGEVQNWRVQHLILHPDQ